MVAAASGSWPGFRECIHLAASFVFLFDCVTSLTIQPSPITVGENQNASFNCQVDPGEPTVSFSVTFNEVPLNVMDPRFFVPTGVSGNLTYTFGPVTRSDDGLVFECSNGMKSASATLAVQFPPSYTLSNELTLSPTVLEGTSSYTYQFTLDANPVTSQFTWTKDGQTLNSSDADRVALTVNSVNISEVRRGDSGTYVVSSMNRVGQASANFTLDVEYPPEFTIPTVRSVQLNSSSPFTFNCTASAANPSSVDYSFRKDGSSQPFSISGPVLTISSVVRTNTGNYSCTANNTVGSTTLYHNLLVVAPPQYSPRASQSTTSLEGSDFTYQFNLDNGGVEPSFTWSRSGTSGVLTNGNKYTLTADSITVKNVSRDDSAMYTVSATNMAGNDSNSFTLDVQYPPSLMKVENSSKSIISGRDELTIDCTPTPGNPSSTNVTFRVNSTEVNQSDSSVSISSNSNVLTISPVERRHRGAYTCTASNGVGQDPSVTVQVDVFGPPTAPRSVAVSGEMSFSATVMWTAPEDSGVSSPFSSPSEALTYHISYSSSSSSTQSLVNDSLEVGLSNLQHSTNYTVSVEASNVHGTSPASNEVQFRTPDSKPILQAVVLAPLSLNNFTANVAFLTVGGQDVASFSITINDSSPAVVDSTPVPDGKGVMVSLLIEGQSFTKGTYYSVKITATNSVGTSEPITGLMFVPNPPMITANFTEVSADDIPSNKCCTGVQLRLAEQPDVSNLKVFLTPQGGNQFTVMVNPAALSLEGSVLYIGGVQAGTDYTAVVTVSNIFGSSPDQHLELEPLLGVPSNPKPPTISRVNGGQVTVELSTAYPGTVQTRSGSMFMFEIQFIKDGQRSTRQSKTEMQAAIPASLFNTSAIFTTNLNPGSYSVSVTAVNEHGRSSAVMSQSTFTVEVTPAPTGDVTITIIIAIVVVVVIVPIVFILAIICIICCIRVKKNKKEKYHVGSEDTELTTNRNAVEKNSLDGDRDSFVETGIYDEVGKETKKPPKPQSTPASTTNGQPQPGGDVYAEVNKPKKTNKAAATPTTPPTGDVYAAVDISKKTKKPKTEAPADKVDPEATLYAEVVQEKKEPAVPPKTEAEYQNPEVDKPIEENELQYAALDFSKAPSSFKKPAPPNPDENVIYSEVTIAKKH